MREDKKKFKPVVKLNDYKKIDGRNAYGSNIDEMILGIKDKEIFLKIMDDKDLKEIPIHQVFDMMIFLAKAMEYFKDAYRKPLMYDPQKPDFNSLDVQGNRANISVDVENLDIDEDIKKFYEFLGRDGEFLGERLRSLYEVVENLYNL